MRPRHTASIAASLLASWLLAALDGGVAAAAQGGFTPPLPAADLPDGTITVKVVGRGMRDIKVGQAVTLLQLETKGERELATVATGDDGRARFEGLKPSQRYVLLLKADGQEHRSAALAGPPRGGLRLLISLAGDLRMGQPGGPGGQGSLPEGHPPTGGGMAGLPPGHPPTAGGTAGGAAGGAAQLSPLSELGADQVRVEVLRGPKRVPAAGIAVTLLQRQEGERGSSQRQLGVTDHKGQLAVTLPAGDKLHFVVRVAHAGMTYSSREFAPQGKVGTKASFQVYDRSSDTSSLRLGAGSHWLCQLAEGRLRFMQLMQIDNPTDAIVDPGASGLLLPLPEGIQSVELPRELQRLVTHDEARNALRLMAPLPPGPLPLQVYYTLPYEGEHLELRQRLPLGLPKSRIEVVRDGPPVQIGGPAVTGEPRAGSRGPAYPLGAIPAGGTLEISFGDLPHHDTQLLTIVLGLSALLALWGIIAAIRAGGRRRARLERREKLIQQLSQLQRHPKADSERSRKRRAALLTELRQLWDEPW